MEDETGAHDPVIRRLQALAGEPVDANTTHRVLAATRHPRRTWWRSARVKVCLGVAGGFLVGSAGLASAGSLPGAAQGAAHTVLGTVGVSVPPGHDRYNDPTACPGGPYANHGAYVRSHKADPNAGQSPCGKPTRSVNGASNANGQQPPATGNNGNGNNGNGNNGNGNNGFGYGNSNGNGPPPWAHGNKNNNGNGNGNGANGNGNGKGNNGNGANKNKDDDDKGDQGDDQPAPAKPAATTTTTAKTP